MDEDTEAAASPFSMPDPPRDGRHRVTQLADRLREQILQAELKPGDRLPSEVGLAEAHSVSRTVVREAIAILRSEGRLDVRRGVGAFVCEPNAIAAPFADLSLERISSVIELIELRIGVESQAASLAAARRSPEQLEAILAAHSEVGRCIRDGQSTRMTDYTLHLRIAEAAQNRRFPELMTLVKIGMVSSVPVTDRDRQNAPMPANENLQSEHAAIVNAILLSDSDKAATAMRTHLEGSLRRYKELLVNGVSG
ncbi:FadR/GntR family transcriptional regulator [Allosediminivita pacifica]|uniref:GntR family transcriptional regulator n=1 Tax=Allosediminivita pacifica TaxID=1267769 RepID=A0A2T5ZXT5_9RHOB|nr:FadR/GntR family transcriptional regulator [Allosediminivita pacifica]PTX36367.1 GntR family transcriptional regulator [Allosediminivita pacifica]GGB30959.1 GntR family transcriptional regulator [Allosediminivita pacifica]